MNAANKTMEKQWEESISAMTKRDQTLQAVQNIKEDVQNQLTEHQITLLSMRSQRDEAESRLKEKEIGKDFIQEIRSETKHFHKKSRMPRYDRDSDSFEV
jgi:hypothetical protein